MDSKLMVRRENEEIEKQLNKTITTEQLVEVKENSFNILSIYHEQHLKDGSFRTTLLL